MNKIRKTIIKVKLKDPKNKDKKRGAEMVETILMIGVTISLIVIVFYPQIRSLMSDSMSDLSGWFAESLRRVAPIVGN